MDGVHRLRVLKILAGTTLLAFTGCAGSGPYRHAEDKYVSAPALAACDFEYGDTDKSINALSLIHI